MDTGRLWSIEYVINMFENFIVYFVFYLTTVILVEFVINNLHEPASSAGLAAGIFIVAGLIGRIITGRFITNIGFKKTLIFGMVLFTLSTSLYHFATSITLLYIIRILHGVGFGVVSTSAGAIVATIVQEERLGEGIGYYALSVTIATALGPFVGMLVVGSGGLERVILVALPLSFIGCCLTFFLKLPSRPLKHQKIVAKDDPSSHKFIEYRVLPISLIGAFIGISYSSIVSFLSSHLRAMELSSYGSIFFVLYALTIVASRPTTGRLFDKMGAGFVMYPALILFTLGLAMLGFAHGPVLLLLSAILIGLGYGTFTPVAQSIAIKVSPPENVGLATSTFFAIFDAGMGIGPFILGYCVPYFGLGGLYECMAVIVLFCIAAYYCSYKNIR